MLFRFLDGRDLFEEVADRANRMAQAALQWRPWPFSRVTFLERPFVPYAAKDKVACAASGFACSLWGACNTHGIMGVDLSRF